jgi:hypothetical protein
MREHRLRRFDLDLDLDLAPDLSSFPDATPSP